MSEAIHELARGFDLVGDEYERGRPGYPDQAISFLADELGIRSGTTVLDLAAGTGKLTRSLVPTGAEVIAVEPLSGMRSKLEKALPEVRALAGVAESIPLGDGSVDAVVVGQAFHWFDPERAAAEIHRVLRSGGGLAALWNMRDESFEWVSELSTIIDRHGEGRPRHASGLWLEGLETSGRFTPVQERVFAHEQRVDRETILSRVASVSFVASSPEAVRAKTLADVERLLTTHPATRGRDEFVLPYRTEVYWCRMIT